MNKLIAALIGSGLILLLSAIARAGSAQWDLNPASGDWNTAADWTPMTVPNGASDTATFDLSNTTNVSISANTHVNGITFTPAASAYAITVNPNLTLTLSGTGITNNSGATQNFMTVVDASGSVGKIVFSNSASAGTNVGFLNNGSMSFKDASTSGDADITNSGSVQFFNRSTGGVGSNSGLVQFFDRSTGGAINNEGALRNS